MPFVRPYCKAKDMLYLHENEKDWSSWGAAEVDWSWSAAEVNWSSWSAAEVEWSG
jgi:hypothetical protein